MAPETVTLSGPRTERRQEVTLSGKTRPGTTVDVYVRVPVRVATLAADSTTVTTTSGVRPSQHLYYARTAKAISGTIIVRVNSSVRITKLALTRRGTGLTVTVKGGPRAGAR